MSVVVSAAVWKNSKAKGGDLLVMLALADFAREDGYCWPSIDTVAKYARMSPRSTQRSIRSLVEAGELAIEEGGGRHRTNTYRILVIGKGDKETPFSEVERVTSEAERVTSEAETLTPTSPDPLRTIKNRIAPPRTPKPKPTAGVPLAVESFRKASHRYPDKATWQAITEGVGEAPADLERWERTVAAYVLIGWNKTNVANMLDYFRRGAIPTPGKNGKNGVVEERGGQVTKNADGSFYV